MTSKILKSVVELNKINYESGNNTLNFTVPTTINGAPTDAAAGLYANAAYAHANAAFVSANNVAPQVQPAFDKANNAYAHANAAFLSANNVAPQVQPAFNKANAAFDAANSAVHREAFIANNGQTLFQTSGYNIGYADVFVNGIKLYANTDFTANDGVYVTVIDPILEQNDVVEIVNWGGNATPIAREDVYARTLANSSSNISNVAIVNANLAYLHANEAYNIANTLVQTNTDLVARPKANAAFDHANAAFATANNVAPQVQPAFDKANNAFNKANSAVHRESFTANSGQTLFQTSGYNTGYVDVFVNGIKLYTSDFTATDGVNITINDPILESNDIVEVINWGGTAEPIARQDSYARDLSNTAWTTSNTAIINANLSFVHANASYNVSNTLSSNIYSAVITANLSYGHAN